MSSPTGNVWIDPDTKKPANPTNVQMDMGGASIPINRKYGPAVLGDKFKAPTELPPNLDPVQATAAAAQLTDDSLSAARAGDSLPELSGRKLADPAKAPEHRQALTKRAAEALDRDKIKLRDLCHQMTDKKLAPELQAKARQLVEQVARNEFAREDGGRAAIKTVLKRYGFIPPEEG